MNAWIALLATVVGALLTAVLGNRLIQFWQQRNWIHQQQFSGLEKEYVALKSLSDSLIKDCGARLSSMRNLVSSLRRGVFQDELEAYRVVLSTWNGAIHAYYAQLTFQLKWDCATHLEHRIHDKFVAAGVEIEGAIRSLSAGSPVRRDQFNLLDSQLDEIAGEIADFSRVLVRSAEERRQEVFYGRKLEYTKSNIIRFSNFDLIKLLFVSDIDGFSVVRSTTDIVSPLGRRL